MLRLLFVGALGQTVCEAARISRKTKNSDYDCDGDGTNDCKDWDYGRARCASGHKCHYKYKFGDFLFDQS